MSDIEIIEESDGNGFLVVIKEFELRIHAENQQEVDAILAHYRAKPEHDSLTEICPLCKYLKNKT